MAYTDANDVRVLAARDLSAEDAIISTAAITKWIDVAASELDRVVGVDYVLPIARAVSPVSFAVLKADNEIGALYYLYSLLQDLSEGDEGDNPWQAKWEDALARLAEDNALPDAPLRYDMDMPAAASVNQLITAAIAEEQRLKSVSYNAGTHTLTFVMVNPGGQESNVEVTLPSDEGGINAAQVAAIVRQVLNTDVLDGDHIQIDLLTTGLSADEKQQVKDAFDIFSRSDVQVIARGEVATWARTGQPQPTGGGGTTGPQDGDIRYNADSSSRLQRYDGGTSTWVDLPTTGGGGDMSTSGIVQHATGTYTWSAPSRTFKAPAVPITLPTAEEAAWVLIEFSDAQGAHEAHWIDEDVLLDLPSVSAGTAVSTTNSIILPDSGSTGAVDVWIGHDGQSLLMARSSVSGTSDVQVYRVSSVGSTLTETEIDARITTLRPDPKTNEVRYDDSSASDLEYYDGSAWQDLATSGLTLAQVQALGYQTRSQVDARIASLRPDPKSNEVRYDDSSPSDLERYDSSDSTWKDIPATGGGGTGGLTQAEVDNRIAPPARAGSLTRWSAAKGPPDLQALDTATTVIPPTWEDEAGDDALGVTSIAATGQRPNTITQLARYTYGTATTLNGRGREWVFLRVPRTRFDAALTDAERARFSFSSASTSRQNTVDRFLLVDDDGTNNGAATWTEIGSGSRDYRYYYYQPPNTLVQGIGITTTLTLQQRVDQMLRIAGLVGADGGGLTEAEVDARIEALDKGIKFVGTALPAAASYNRDDLALIQGEGIYEVVDAQGASNTLPAVAWTPTQRSTTQLYGFDLRSGETQFGTRPTGWPTTIQAMFRDSSNDIWFYATAGTFSTNAQGGLEIVVGGTIFTVPFAQTRSGIDIFRLGPQPSAEWTTSSIQLGIHALGNVTPFTAATKSWSKVEAAGYRTSEKILAGSRDPQSDLFWFILSNGNLVGHLKDNVLDALNLTDDALRTKTDILPETAANVSSSEWDPVPAPNPDVPANERGRRLRFTVESARVGQPKLGKVVSLADFRALPTREIDAAAAASDDDLETLTGMWQLTAQGTPQEVTFKFTRNAAGKFVVIQSGGGASIATRIRIEDDRLTLPESGLDQAAVDARIAALRPIPPAPVTAQVRYDDSSPSDLERWTGSAWQDIPAKDAGLDTDAVDARIAQPARAGDTSRWALNKTDPKLEQLADDIRAGGWGYITGMDVTAPSSGPYNSTSVKDANYKAVGDNTGLLLQNQNIGVRIPKTQFESQPVTADFARLRLAFSDVREGLTQAFTTATYLDDDATYWYYNVPVAQIPAQSTPNMQYDSPSELVDVDVPVEDVVGLDERIDSRVPHTAGLLELFNSNTPSPSVTNTSNTTYATPVVLTYDGANFDLDDHAHGVFEVELKVTEVSSGNPIYFGDDSAATSETATALISATTLAATEDYVALTSLGDQTITIPAKLSSDNSVLGNVRLNMAHNANNEVLFILWFDGDSGSENITFQSDVVIAFQKADAPAAMEGGGGGGTASFGTLIFNRQVTTRDSRDFVDTGFDFPSDTAENIYLINLQIPSRGTFMNLCYGPNLLALTGTIGSSFNNGVVILFPTFFGSRIRENAAIGKSGNNMLLGIDSSSITIRVRIWKMT